MVIFNESRISPDGKKLIIDVSVDEASYFDDVYINSIVIDNQHTFSGLGPSGDPVYAWEDEDPLIVNGQTVYKRHVRLELQSSDIDEMSISNSMFYVYVILGGEPAEETPCELKKDFAIRVVFDYGPIYRQTMNYIKELNERCEVPLGLVDRILKLNALELSLMSGNYSLANSYWIKFFSKNRNKLKSNKLCCDG